MSRDINLNRSPKDEATRIWIKENETRRKIVKALKENVMYFSQLSEELDIPKTTLQRPIRELQNSNVIKEVEQELDEKKKFYTLTEKGNKIAKSLQRE